MEPSRIKVGGLERDLPIGPGAPGGRGWRRLAAAVGVALAAVVVFQGIESPSTDVAGETRLEAPVPETVPTGEPLAVLVPGLAETLVIVETGRLDGTTNEVSVWPPDVPQPESRALAAGALSPDAGGAWLASVTPTRFPDLAALWVGTADGMDPLATEVTGALWHPTDPGRLLWGQVEGDQTVMVEAQLGSASEPARTLVASIPEGSRPVWWTPHGVVLQAGLSIVQVDPSGALRETQAEFVAGGPHFALVLVDGRPTLVEPRLDRFWGAAWAEDCSAAAFPADGDYVAAVCSTGADTVLRVMESAGTEFPSPVAEVAGVAPDVTPAWTRDGRFVAAALRAPTTGIVFVDTADGTARVLERWGRVLSLTFVRPASPG